MIRYWSPVKYTQLPVSTLIWCIPPPFITGLPSAPLDFEVDQMTRDTVSLTWSRPSNTGGVPLTGYVLQVREGRAPRWTTVATVEPHRTWWTVHNLIQGYEYYFRVLAENPDGVGDHAALSGAVVPKPTFCEYNVLFIDLYLLSLLLLCIVSCCYDSLRILSCCCCCCCCNSLCIWCCCYCHICCYCYCSRRKMNFPNLLSVGYVSPSLWSFSIGMFYHQVLASLHITIDLETV